MRIEHKQKPILIGQFISGLTCGIAWPVVHARMINSFIQSFENGEAAYARFSAIENFVACLAGLFVSFLWPRIQKYFVKYYVKLEIIETFLITLFYITVYYTNNAVFYFIADLSYYCIIGALISKCGSTCRNFLFPTPEDKTNADTNTEFFGNASSLLGFGISSTFLQVSFGVGILLFLIGDLVRSVGVIYTYTKYSNYLIPAYNNK